MVLKTAAINFPLLTTTQCRHTPANNPPATHSLPTTCTKLLHTHHTKCTVTLK